MRVLVVEDSPVYRKLLSGCLEEWGFRPVVAETGEQAWRLLRERDAPNLVVLDWVLPDMDGIALCERIRKVDANKGYVYVILLTGKDGRQHMLKAMQCGADDYLTKPFDAPELKARLMVGKRIVELQQELVSAREAMRHSATYDSLTGVMNRGEIMEFLRRELERGRRDHKPVAIILVDIDHFKRVNDLRGHLFGDEALKEVARRLRTKLRIYDGVGRYGGEEFLLVLPGCDSMTALIRADQLREQVSSKPVGSSKLEQVITVSMGVASSEESSDAETLLSQADAGLYRAKHNGRNRVEHIERVDLVSNDKRNRNDPLYLSWSKLRGCSK
jgi:diguanylate cyclase (GGDEF)-like protein